MGILFAPDKGTNTRKKISKKSEDFAAELSNSFNSFIEQITERFESVQNDATHMVEKGKEKWDEVREEADKMAHNTMSQAKKNNL